MTLSTQDLVLGYQNQRVIPAANIVIEEGDLVSLVGPNGCGKSTLLGGLGGLLKPISGQVSLAGQCLSKWQQKALARYIALLPQSPSAPDSISVAQLVRHGRYPHQGLLGLNSQDDVDAVEWALEMTGTIVLRDRNFSTLSGGEKQRVWIAMALAQQSKIILLDEPTTYLDVGHQLDVLNLLVELNQKHRLTVVMVLHDINHASQYSDRIIAMHNGKVIADGKPVDVVTERLLDELFAIEVELIQRREGHRCYPYCLPLRNDVF